MGPKIVVNNLNKLTEYQGMMMKKGGIKGV
jgi:hypothetical protein